MRELRTPVPMLVAIAVTRGLLGVGVGLLLSERIKRKHRREVGATLAAIGALSTIPLAIGLFRKVRERRAPTPVDGATVANVPQSGIDATEGLRAD
jgi:hypothetical protein